MSSAFRPFLLIPESSLASLREQLSAAYTQWCREWTIQTVFDVTVQACVPEMPASTRWIAHTAATGPQLWAADTGDAMRSLHAALFGAQHSLSCTDREGDLSWSAVSQAREALFAGLYSVVGNAPLPAPETHDALPAAFLSPGAGIVHVHLGSPGVDILFAGLSITAPVSQRMPARKAVSIEECVRTQHVQLSVMAGAAEIELSRLLELGAGDVVLLDTRLDDPLQLAGPSFIPLARCALGRQGGHRAVQLAR